MTTTHRLLDLAAEAPRIHDADLLLLMREASELYSQELADSCRAMAEQCAALPDAELTAAAAAAGVPRDGVEDRDELVMLLALAAWERTPAGMAYLQLAEDAARRGVSLVPEV
ncbi:hypothetical protein [Streptomyces sp. NPDC050145]|uniref:hypothetical protein n=1 Tax=Streptomyces sp. NPDC050145 TaxID=3365602 RepID=UPI0037B2F6AF